MRRDAEYIDEEDESNSKYNARNRTLPMSDESIIASLIYLLISPPVPVLIPSFLL